MTGQHWYWFTPFMPRLAREHCGTGYYFDDLDAAKQFAAWYSQSLRGDWHGKPIKVIDVHHTVVAIVRYNRAKRSVRK